MSARIAAALLAGTFLTAAGQASVLAWLAWRGPLVTRADLMHRLRAVPEDASPQRLLARVEERAGRFERARARLAAALRRSPLAADLWLERAEAALHAGRIGEALRAAERACALAPVDADLNYRAALVLLQAGDVAAAAPRLRSVLENAPDLTAQVLELAHGVYRDDTLVLRRIVPPEAESVRRFLAWAYDRRLTAAASAGWDALLGRGAALADRLQHVSFLIEQGEIETAASLWVAAYGPWGGGRVFEGGFERDPVNAGFGWVFHRFEGVRVRVAGGAAAAEGTRGLVIEFSGGNPEFAHVTQIVPVTGGRRYRLSALMRAEGLTSLSGPRLEVQAHVACPGMVTEEGPELRGTRAWGPVSIEFATPPGCRAVRVLVHRVRTDRFDRDVRGRLYLDDVRLLEVGEA
jgi:hypothetical protein